MDTRENPRTFLEGGGEMGGLIRAHDWSETPLGPVESWPASLRATVRLMLNSQHPMFIWWGPELIQLYNDAYRTTMGPEMHPSALGAPGRESWREIWPIIGPQIDLVMAGKGSTWNVEQMVPIHRHGRWEEVWWTYGYSPIDLEDRVGGVLVVCTDLTEQHRLMQSLRAQTERLARQFEQAPGFIAMLRGPEHVFELANAAYRRLIGGRDVIGKPIREALPDLAGQGFYELLDEVLRTGATHVGRRTPVTLQATAAEPPQHVFLDFVYQAVTDPDGAISGIFVEGQDVTDHVLAEQQVSLINRELQHRVKNTLAMVGAIAGQTLGKVADPKAMSSFNQRLAAFGAAHDALTAARTPTAIVAEVIGGALGPHMSEDGRFRLAGPQVVIGSKQALSLAMAIHELATNAAKYGALSVPAGHVELVWRMTGSGDDELFQLDWEEHGGPPVAPPGRRGFGSRLIEDVLAAEFEGRVELRYEPGGLRLRLLAPASRLRPAG